MAVSCMISKIRLFFYYCYYHINGEIKIYIKQYIGRKSGFFHTTPAFDAPLSTSEYCHNVWYKKN